MEADVENRSPETISTLSRAMSRIPDPRRRTRHVCLVLVRYLLYIAMFAAFLLISPGCATVRDGETLSIDTRNVLGARYMPDEVTLMLSELGFRWIPINDPEIDRPVKMVRRYGEFRMRFEYAESGQVRIDARMSERPGVTRLHFYEPGSESLGASSRELLRRLRERAESKFGRANVGR